MMFAGSIAFIVLFPIACYEIACAICDYVQPKYQNAIEDVVLIVSWLAAIAIVWNY